MRAKREEEARGEMRVEGDYFQKTRSLYQGAWCWSIPIVVREYSGNRRRARESEGEEIRGKSKRTEEGRGEGILKIGFTVVSKSLIVLDPSQFAEEETQG